MSAGPTGEGGLPCALVRDLLPLHFYQEVDGPAGLDLAKHLGTCAPCAREWDRTRRALGGVDPDGAFPREREVDWAGLARETAARARRAARPAGERRPALWAALAAAAAAVLLTTTLWRMPGGPPAPAAPFGGDVRLLQDNVARRAAARSLTDARALLVDLTQATLRCRRGDASCDVALEKARSQALIRRIGLYRGALAGPGDRRLAELMGQMETFLLQVSALDDCATVPQIRELREAMERKQLLLRIDLVTREIEEGGARA